MNLLLKTIRRPSPNVSVDIEVTHDAALGLVLSVQVTVSGVDLEVIQIPLDGPVERWRSWRERRREKRREVERWGSVGPAVKMGEGND